MFVIEIQFLRVLYLQPLLIILLPWRLIVMMLHQAWRLRILARLVIERVTGCLYVQDTIRLLPLKLSVPHDLFFNIAQESFAAQSAINYETASLPDMHRLI